MEQVVRTLEELGVEPKMTRATLSTLSEVAAAGLREKLGDEVIGPEKVLAALRLHSGP